MLDGWKAQGPRSVSRLNVSGLSVSGLSVRAGLSAG